MAANKARSLVGFIGGIMLGLLGALGCLAIQSVLNLTTPVPTSSLKDSTAAALGEECRAVVDGLDTLKKGLIPPKHLLQGDPVKPGSDFDPVQYFSIMTHLSLEPGYSLEYIYYADGLGGRPVLYARPADRLSFQSYQEWLESLGDDSAGQNPSKGLKHRLDYLGKIQIDQSSESYFEFIVLALLGDQFYLNWHALYNDTRILCDVGDLQYIIEDLSGFNGMELPSDVRARAGKIEFSPSVRLDEKTVTLRLVTFTKWGGFYENIYTIERVNPVHFEAQRNQLIEYQCGINF